MLGSCFSAKKPIARSGLYRGVRQRRAHGERVLSGFDSVFRVWLFLCCLGVSKLFFPPSGVSVVGRSARPGALFSRMVSIALEVTCSLVVWLALYACLCFWNKHRSCEWSCRLVTLLHGVIVTGLSGYAALLDGPWALTHAGAFGVSQRPCHAVCSHLE